MSWETVLGNRLRTWYEVNSDLSHEEGEKEALTSLPCVTRQSPSHTVPPSLSVDCASQTIKYVFEYLSV